MSPDPRRRRRSANALLLALAMGLGGCGLSPIYSGGGQGPAARQLAGVEVADIPDRAGYLLRSALQDRLGRGDSAPRYRLEVELDDDITGFGIRADDSITRERRTLRTRYRLVSIESGAVLLESTAASDAGIDVVQSDYAVVAAENSALERVTADIAQQIAGRVALFARASAPTLAR